MTHDHGSIYYLKDCLQCAAALVQSARPSRKHQEAMLAHACQFWSREEILKEVANANSSS